MQEWLSVLANPISPANYKTVTGDAMLLACLPVKRCLVIINTEKARKKFLGFLRREDYKKEEK